MNALTPLNSTTRRACSETTSVGRPAEPAEPRLSGGRRRELGNDDGLSHRDNTRAAGSESRSKALPLRITVRSLRRLEMSAKWIRVKNQQVGELARFDRAEVVEAA